MREEGNRNNNGGFLCMSNEYLFCDNMIKWHELNELIRARHDWQERIKEVANSMDYEDYSQCGLEDLIALAGLEEEVELALKQEKIENRINKMKEDFK